MTRPDQPHALTELAERIAQRLHPVIRPEGDESAAPPPGIVRLIEHELCRSGGELETRLPPMAVALYVACGACVGAGLTMLLV